MKGELCSQASAQVIRNPPTQWVLLITDIVMPAGGFVEGKCLIAVLLLYCCRTVYFIFYIR